MSVTTTRNGTTPAEQLRQQLTRMGPELKNALPSHISPEKFQRVVLTVASLNPDLLNADRKALLGACMRCAADGLVPDGREAALVLFGGKPQYMPMVAGLLKRARNSGEISTISAHVVYEHDEFKITLGDDEAITHNPAWATDRGKMIGVYAIAKLKDGGIQRALLSAAEVEKIRNVSRSKGAGPWVQWTEEMWKKSALRRLTKYLPMDAETEHMERMLKHDDEPPVAIEGVVEDVSAVTDQSSKLDSLAGDDGNVTVDADGVIQGEAT